MKKGLKFIVWFILFFSFSIKIHANSQLDIVNTTFKVDVKSMHVWRGIATSFTPTLEPSLEVNKGNSTTGIWLAQSFDGKYTELDLYFIYNFNDFSFTIYDYYCPPSIQSSDEIANYRKYETNHTIELNFSFNSSENIPFTFLVATMIYGDDIHSETNENNYSTYLQLAYSTQIDENSIDLILGFNAFESYYGSQFGIINAGITTSRNLKTFKTFKIPVQASLITNPLANYLFLSLGFTL